MLKMLNRPMARWQGLALAILFFVAVWQFGNYLDNRREISDARTLKSTSQLQAANKQLLATAHAQRQQNIANAHLRNAVCTIFIGIPAPPKNTQFGKLWHHAIKEAQCGKTIVIHHKKKSTTVVVQPRPTATTTVTVTPHPTQPASRPGPTKRHHKPPAPAQTCVLPTGMVIKCIKPPVLTETTA